MISLCQSKHKMHNWKESKKKVEMKEERDERKTELHKS